MNIEKIILSNLINNDQFRKKSLPFISADYFTDSTEKRLYTEVAEYIDKYKAAPSKSAIELRLDAMPLKADDLAESKKQLDEVYSHPGGEQEEWLIDETEKFCKTKALHNAIYESIQIIDTKRKTNKSPNVIPDILRDALSVSFDTKVGHEYFDNAEDRFNLYLNPEFKIPFDLEMLNTITEGGLSRKTLNIILAPPGGGKSIFLCHYAAACLKANLNVLYITCEMSEERIAERIDANLIDVNVSDIKFMAKKQFLSRIDKLKTQCKGKLIIKEYANGSANALHFRHLIEELKTKKKFLPDVIVIDYLNICESYKFKKNSSANSYTIIKSVAEEIRALAQEYNVPILSAAQFNRSGAASSDPTQENVAESAGLNHTADLMLAIVTTDELEAYKQVMIKQLKNRYADVAQNRKFLLGLDKPKMRFFDVVNPGSTTNNSKSAASFTLPEGPELEEDEQPFVKPNKPQVNPGFTHRNIFTGKSVEEDFDAWK